MRKVKNETPRARKLKQLYLELGPERTIKKTAEAYEKNFGKCSNRYLELLSGRFGWVKAAKEYDVNYEELIKAKHIKEIAEMQDRHAKESILLQSLAISKMKNAKPEQLRLRDCARFLRDGVHIERLSRGLSDRPAVEINNTEVNVDARVQSVQNVNKVIVGVLDRFPDAREAVLSALEKKEEE
jgi:hypothetical protein